MKEYTSFIKSSKIKKGPCVFKFDNLLKKNIFSSNIIVVKYVVYARYFTK